VRSEGDELTLQLVGPLERLPRLAFLREQA
jgi:hypothetical protein